MITIEQRNAGARRRYDKNREAHNALRRDNYANDKDAREKARVRASDYRAGQRDGTVTIQRTLTRELNGVQVEVLSTGQVADTLGRTPQMLRNWERGGLIPASSFNDTHRLYTRRQARLVQALAETIATHGGSWVSGRVKQKVRTIAKNW